MKLCIDFETHDPYINRGLGAGWVFKLNNVPNNDFEILGAALMTRDRLWYSTDIEEIKRVAEEASMLICHNAQYDLGCLYAIGANIKDKPVIDTMIAAKLFDSTLMSYGLDALCYKYFNKRKANDSLTDAVWEADMYPWLKKELNDKEKALKRGETYERVRPDEKKLEKFCKNNMKEIQNKCPEAMAKYAMEDASLTVSLLELYKNSGLDLDLVEMYSFVAHICIEYRKNGVRVDLDRAREVETLCEQIYREKLDKIYKNVGYEFNINSIVQLPKVFDELGITYPRTAKGNPSITGKWLSTQENKICQMIVDARKAAKIKSDFTTKVIEMQEYTLGISLEEIKDVNIGILFPELNILQARTGRFSSSCPNIQQIPKVSKDNKFGYLCRSMYIPNEGETWYSLDFSNQEGRLQLHYAHKLKCEGTDELVLLFKNDPKFDMHGKIAKMAEIERKHAKTINLGISYGMGVKKLANSLGTKRQSAELLLEKYHNTIPFLKELNTICSKTLKSRGYITTLGRRKLKLDDPMIIDGRKCTFEYRALNKLIQGSAADQTIAAMIWAYHEGIPVLFPVHDELNMSSNNIEHAKRLKHIMENCMQLEIPMYTEICQGHTWADAK